MPKRITIANHQTVSELFEKYRQEQDAVARSHYQIIWLLASGKKTEEVAATTGYTVYWVRELARRYNQLGIEGLGDRRHNNPGAETLLDEVQTAQLLQAIEGPAPDGGLWNGRKVADWMSELLERPIAPQRGWEYLKAMEYSLRIPRPENKQADLLEQEAWKKKIPHKLQELEQKYPDAQIELWAEDEHRIGLKPI